MIDLSTMDNVLLAVRQWGVDKGLTGPEGKATIKGQYDKLEEEFQELGEALSYGNIDEIVDAIGDMTVVLTLLCDLVNKEYPVDVDMPWCLRSAYNVISKRTGTMVDGQFQKDK